MAHSSSSKNDEKEDTDSDSEDEVNRDPDSLLAEITGLNGLIDNRDSVLRDAKKTRKDLRAQLENASEKVGELESKLLELKLTPSIFDDVECPECDAWLNEIKLLNEKNASTLAKLDALRTEYDELTARPTLLGACKSCPTMHAKLVDARSTISTVDASLKSPVVNTCTSVMMLLCAILKLLPVWMSSIRRMII
jgi:phage shock protein A